MTWSASMASSRAVTFCSGSGMPVALRNTERVRPRAFTRSFMMRAKVGSSPAIASASAMAASLPACTIRPCRMSESLIRLRTAANIVVPRAGAPPLRQAFSEMPISLSSVRRPAAISWKATSAVAIFAMLAGATGSSGAFS